MYLGSIIQQVGDAGRILFREQKKKKKVGFKQLKFCVIIGYILD